MTREETLGELLKACRQMLVDKSWPVTEEELVKYHNSSFEFGFACGALWQREVIWHSCDEEPDGEEFVLIHQMDTDYVFSCDILRAKYIKDKKEKHPEITILKWAYLRDVLSYDRRIK